MQISLVISKSYDPVALHSNIFAASGIDLYSAQEGLKPSVPYFSDLFDFNHFHATHISHGLAVG